MPNAKQAILSANAPQPIGPYSQAIRAGNFLFCSGQIALDPVSGKMLEEGVEAQTRLVMKNIAAVLEAGGSSFEQIVKTTIFLKSMGDFPKVNEIYGAYFKGTPPARSTIEVSQLPKGGLVEIEVIAEAN